MTGSRNFSKAILYMEYLEVWLGWIIRSSIWNSCSVYSFLDIVKKNDFNVTLHKILNRPKLCGNCAFPQNFSSKELGEISVFYAVSRVK